MQSNSNIVAAGLLENAKYIYITDIWETNETLNEIYYRLRQDCS